LEGVIDRNGTYQFLDAAGKEGSTQLLSPREVNVRREKPSAQDLLVPLIAKLVKDNEKVIVFRNARGPAQGCAAYLSRDLGLQPATEAMERLPAGDNSSASTVLRECLRGGTAFHNSNLTREERIVVEQSFRDPKSTLRVLAATTTVAAGINTPASTVAENLKGFSHNSSLDATLNLTPGTHRVGIFSAGWDNLVQQYMWTGGAGFTFPLTVGLTNCPTQGDGIIVCSPLNDTTLGSSVLAWAVAQLTGTNIVRMEVWVDGVKKFSTFGSNTLKTKLTLATGVHKFEYYVIGADGSKLSSSVRARVK